LIQQWGCFGQINDVNAISGCKNILLHFGVPALGLVAKVNACFQQVLHRSLSLRHDKYLLVGIPDLAGPPPRHINSKMQDPGSKNGMNPHPGNSGEAVGV
jgi:hypothetical protein